MKRLLVCFVILSFLNYGAGSQPEEGVITGGEMVEKGKGRVEKDTSAASSIRDGLHETHYAGGVLKSSANYKDGKLDGVYKEYYEDGTLASEMNYKDGNLADGVAKAYYPSGTVHWETVQDGGQQIISRVYYEDGTVKSENYVDGEQTKYKEYDEQGKLLVERTL